VGDNIQGGGGGNAAADQVPVCRSWDFNWTLVGGGPHSDLGKTRLAPELLQRIGGGGLYISSQLY
jgi:hypothetical protein